MPLIQGKSASSDENKGLIFNHYYPYLIETLAVLYKQRDKVMDNQKAPQLIKTAGHQLNDRL